MNRTKGVSRLMQQARKSLGLDGDSQQDLVRRARKSLGMTTKELAELLDKSIAAVGAWQAPEGAAKHRKMPDAVRLLLAQLLRQHRAQKRKA